jgi:hypothetical protein
MKLKAYFEKVKTQGKIGGDDLNKFIEALPEELEIPDVAANLIEENFLTRDRAINDFKIINKIKAEALNGVDAVLNKFLPTIDATTREEIEKEPNTYKKLELIQAAIPKLLEKAQSGNPNSEERVKQLEANYKEMVDKVKSINTEREQKERELKEQFETEKKTLKVDWTLEKQLSKYTFADEFINVKDALTKGILTDIRSKHSLDLNDQGELVVVEIDPQTKVQKQKFNGNDPVTIDSLLAEPLKPFLKKSEASKAQQGGQSNSGRTAIHNPAIGDPSKMTLNEMRRAGKTTTV